MSAAGNVSWKLSPFLVTVTLRALITDDGNVECRNLEGDPAINFDIWLSTPNLRPHHDKRLNIRR